MNSIDVIVPCYNYCHFLRECVVSVLTQTGLDLRVLILDDASPDETPEVARSLMEEDPRVFYRRHQENKGHINTYNEGIDWVSASYYLLLSADDYLLPGSLERAARMLDTNPNVAFVFGNAIEHTEQGGKIPIRPCLGPPDLQGSRIIKGLDFVRMSLASNIVPTPTAIIRTQLQKECGGYKTDFPHAGDMEMWFRLAVRGDVGFIDFDQAVQRRHGKNMSESYLADKWLLDIKQRFEALQHFFQENGWAFSDLDAARRKSFLALASEAVSFASWAFNDGDESLSRQLAHYALKISPEVRTTPQWHRMVVKRIIGPRVWCFIHRVLR